MSEFPTDRKLSIDDYEAQIDVTHHNSNVSNLAHARRSINRALKLAEETVALFETKAVDLSNSITEMANGEPTELTCEQVRKAYDMAQTAEGKWERILAELKGGLSQRP